MDLFYIQEYEVRVKNEVWLIDVFNDIKLKYDNIELATSELAYVYYMASYTSDYSDILDEIEKSEVVKSEIFKGVELKLDKSTKIAIQWYKDRQQTVTMRLLEDTYFAVNELRKFYRNVKIESPRDASAITKAVGELAKVVDSIELLQSKVKKELAIGSGAKGSMTKSEFEDPNEY